MSHLLEQRLRQVRRRLRGLLAIYGVSWVVGCVLSAVILLGSVDYLLRFRDPGIRLFCTLAIVGLTIWAVRRYLIEAPSDSVARSGVGPATWPCLSDTGRRLAKRDRVLAATR